MFTTGGTTNCIGIWRLPCAVLVDPSLLRWLPLRELRSGMSEILKLGIIGDSAILAALEDASINDDSLRDLAINLVPSCIRSKERIVATGHNISLNFGHTVGHCHRVCAFT